ncbi:shikimate kinase [Halobacillus locisalis]|uniref:Shikimate kinase n=1 Tax=Halobacillus locisalis TaxID=220753 RepID=A0A838CNT8_9BACI|nr:shikimate kinase [Halobacillus locisalis]MBA2173614.1 shikimate kinase [Halobacillus locisalis]
MIFLVGFMGSGKSTVAKELGKQLAMPVIEMDEAIEEEEGMTIKTLFEKFGESYFREKETTFLKTIKADSVVSTGGGIVEREENEIPLSTGKVVYLQASWETIVERLQQDTTRPLWNGDDEQKKKRFENRQGKYERVADETVVVDGKDSDQIVSEIIHRLKG